MVRLGRSPRGERGLKQTLITDKNPQSRRSPRGERGLKLAAYPSSDCPVPSLPTWGAWIETENIVKNATLQGRSPRGERGLKQIQSIQGCMIVKSLPTWGAWIETDHRPDK